MPRKLHIIIVSIIVIMGFSVAYLLVGGSRQEIQQNDQSGSGNDSPPAAPQQQQAPSQTSPGMYTDYRADSIATTAGTKILFFHAPWCPQCRQLDADIKSQGLPEGVTIFKVDYDTSQALRQKYGVTIQTTLVKVDDQGNLIKKFVAYDDPTLRSVTKNLLQ